MSPNAKRMNIDLGEAWIAGAIVWTAATRVSIFILGCSAANDPTTMYSAPAMRPTFTAVVESKNFVCWSSISLTRS
jgi:hypothetical protein